MKFSKPVLYHYVYRPISSWGEEIHFVKYQIHLELLKIKHFYQVRVNIEVHRKFCPLIKNFKNSIFCNSWKNYQNMLCGKNQTIQEGKCKKKNMRIKIKKYDNYWMLLQLKMIPNINLLVEIILYIKKYSFDISLFFFYKK